MARCEQRCVTGHCSLAEAVSQAARLCGFLAHQVPPKPRNAFCDGRPALRARIFEVPAEKALAWKKIKMEVNPGFSAGGNDRLSL